MLLTVQDIEGVKKAKNILQSMIFEQQTWPLVETRKENEKIDCFYQKMDHL